MTARDVGGTTDRNSLRARQANGAAMLVEVDAAAVAVLLLVRLIAEGACQTCPMNTRTTPVTRRIFGTLFLLNFTLLSAAMAGKTGLKAKWRHLADLPRSGERHPHHGTALPYAPSNFQLRREGTRGCTFGITPSTPAMALRSAAKSA